MCKCLQDFNIPLNLSTTINSIIGKERVEAVETVQVDASLKPIEGTKETIACDALLLSVGLIPENELSRKAGILLDPMTGGPLVDEDMATNVPGIYAAGNVVTIYDLVDYVSKAGFVAGKNAALYAQGVKSMRQEPIEIRAGENVRTVIPQRINRDLGANDEFLFELRVGRPFEKKVYIEVMEDNRVVKTFKENYARPAEMILLKMKGSEFAQAISPTTKEFTVRAVEA